MRPPQRLFDRHHVDTRLELIACGDRIDIAVELVDGAALQRTVEKSEQYGILGEQLFRVTAVALGDAFYEFHGGSFHRLVLFDTCSHNFRFSILLQS